MLIEITGDEELSRLLGIEQGYLLSVENLQRVVIIHTINCRSCNPEFNDNVKPSDYKKRKNGEFWFSNNHDQILSKMEEFTAQGYTVSLCHICNAV